MKCLKKLIVLNFILISPFLYAQEENVDSGNDAHQVYIAVTGGGFHASKKTSYYYDGYGENDIVRLLQIPQIYSQIFNKIQYPFTMGEYPAAPRYRVGINLGVEAGWWVSEYTALTLGADYVSLKINEAFTLEADNPANLSGDPLIFTEQIIGAEQRFQFNLGLHHDVGDNYKMMTFFEWGVNFNALKPTKHEVLIEETLRYNLMFQQNYFTFVPRTTIGFGGVAAFGVRMGFENHMGLDFGLKAYFQKISLGDLKENAFSQLLFLRLVYM
jgi:hypothetical protein